MVIFVYYNLLLQLKWKNLIINGIKNFSQLDSETGLAYYAIRIFGYQILNEIDLCVIGDEIIIKAVYGTYTYKIYDYEIIEAKALNEKLEINDNKEILMVYTCYPVDTPGYKSKRYVIYASLVGDSNE